MGRSFPDTTADHMQRYSSVNQSQETPSTSPSLNQQNLSHVKATSHNFLVIQFSKQGTKSKNKSELLSDN